MLIGRARGLGEDRGLAADLSFSLSPLTHLSAYRANNMLFRFLSPASFVETFFLTIRVVYSIVRFVGLCCRGSISTVQFFLLLLLSELLGE